MRVRLAAAQAFGGPRLFRALALVAAGALAAATAAVLFLWDPAGRAYPFCLFHALTRLYCPGCGSLRALHQLLHGHVLTALGLNPLMVLSLPLVAYALAGHALRWMGWSVLRPLPVRPWMGWAAVAAVVLFGVLRNLPAWPFCLLAP